MSKRPRRSVFPHMESLEGRTFLAADLIAPAGIIIAPPPITAGTAEIQYDGQPIRSVIDWGDCYAKVAAPGKTFSILNVHDNQSMRVLSVTATAGFIVTPPTPTTVPAGRSTTFSVRLDTSVRGTYSGTVTIRTTDPSHSTLTFSVTGRVVRNPADGPYQEVEAVAYQPGPYGTGDSIVVTPSMVDHGGNMTALGAAKLEFCLSLDQGWDSSDLVLATQDFHVPVLKDQQSFSPLAVLPLSFGNVVEGDYYLGIRATIGKDPSAITWSSAADITLYNTASYTRLTNGGRLNFPDANGDMVTISYSGLGFVDFSTDNGLTGARAAGDLQSIVVGNSTAQSSLRIDTRGKGTTSVQDVYVRGSASGVVAPKLNLQHTATVNSGIATLSLGDMADGSTLALGGTTADKGVAIKLGKVVNLNLTSTAPIKSLAVADWQDSKAGIGKVQAPRIDKLTSAGSFESDLILLGAADAKLSTLASVKIAGNLHGTWDITGNMGDLNVGGTVISSTLRSSGNMGAIRLGAANAVNILAGVTSGITHATGSGDYLAQAAIKSFSVRGGKGFAKGSLLFQGSNVSAYAVGNVDLLGVDFSKTGTAFGLFGHGISSVRYSDVTGARWTWPVKGSFQGPPNSDFGIHVY